MSTWVRVLLYLWLVTLLAGCVSSSPSPVPSETGVTALSPSPTPSEAVVAAPTLTSAPECASLLTAVKNQDAALTQACLQQGQDANQTDPDGISVLNYAAAYGNVDIVAALLEAGSDVNYQDPWGMTSLHAALKEGHEEAALMLLEHGADVNLQTTGGYYVGFTPLYTAVYFGKVGPAVIEELLKKGADVTIPDHAGSTPLQMASEKGLEEIEALLIQYGAEE